MFYLSISWSPPNFYFAKLCKFAWSDGFYHFSFNLFAVKMTSMGRKKMNRSGKLLDFAKAFGLSTKWCYDTEWFCKFFVLLQTLFFTSFFRFLMTVGVELRHFHHKFISTLSSLPVIATFFGESQTLEMETL